jgi:hypothetical protein
MGTSQHGQLPPDLLGGQRRFRAWREHRKRVVAGREPTPILQTQEKANSPAKNNQDAILIRCR